MNTTIITNYSRVRFSALLLPLLVIAFVIVYLYTKGALTPLGYVEIQKDIFYFLNKILSKHSDFQYNITQLGDALIILSLLGVSFLYFPKMWEALFSASLLSLIFSGGLKEIIDVPRPATILDNQSFNIIGEVAIGYSSLPSGHSITIFTTLSVLMCSFLPKRKIISVLWCIFIILLGLFFAFSRVGVGAHYPFDVILGSSIGVICGLLGVFITRKYPLWTWISSPKFYPFFMVLFLVCLCLIIHQIMEENVIIFYFSAFSLLISLYLITKAYVIYIKK